MTLVFLGLFFVLLVLVVVSSLGKPNKLIRFMIHILGGIVGLWLVNLLFSAVNIQIPINIFTVILVALLGFPGVVILTVFQFLGI